jgi:predicted Asp-tRNA(Asn)/Glu-tRNA(Gln) amidotransferase subunit C
MAEERQREIERSAEEIVESFVKAAEALPSERETYYSQEAANVTRPDGEPSRIEERSDFRKRFIKIMPGSDEDGNLRVEVAKWK